jgi:Phytanoyl-CoA dioxygenase (PhyH)
MTTNVLGPAEIESFIELGYCTLPGTFSAEQAAAARRRVWQRMEEKAGIRENDPATWPACYDIEEHLTSHEVLACFTDRLAAAVAQLLGQDRWCGVRKWGLWPVNFAVGAGESYDFPSWGWHIDGNWFPHSIDCPKQGLLLIGLFTDIAPRGGGTILALGSHKRTARVLARHSRPITHLDLFSEVLSEPLGNFYEITGAAGDVVLAHPFLFHNRGMKHRGPPRIISNTEAGLRQPMMLERTNGDYSILELSIRRALREPAIPPTGAKKCWF